MRPALRRALLLPVVLLALGVLPALAYFDLGTVDAYGTLSQNFNLTGATTTFTLSDGGPGGGQGEVGATTVNAKGPTVQADGGVVSNVPAQAFTDLANDYTTISSYVQANVPAGNVSPVTVDLSTFEGGTLVPGLYEIQGNANLVATENLNLDSGGVGGDIYIYVTGDLDIASGATVTLTGAPPESAANVVWVVAGDANFGDFNNNGSATFAGTIIAQGTANLTTTPPQTLTIKGKVLAEQNLNGQGILKLTDVGIPPTITVTNVNGELPSPVSGDGSTAAKALVICQGMTLSYTVTGMDNPDDISGDTALASTNSTGGSITGYSDGLPNPGAGPTTTTSVSYTPPVAAFGPGNPEAFSVTYTATDQFGALESVTLFIRVSTAPSINVAGNSSPYCDGSPVSLTVTATDQDTTAGETFTLSSPSGLPAGVTANPPLPDGPAATGGAPISTNITFTASGTTTFTLQATNSDGCMSAVSTVTVTGEAQSVISVGSVTGNVNASPSAGTSSTNPYTYCVGGTPLGFTITATEPNGGGNTVMLSDGGLPPGATMSPALPSSGSPNSSYSSTFSWTTGTATIPVQIMYSAVDSASGCAPATLSVWVQAALAPTISINPTTNPIAGCVGMNTAFEAIAADSNANPAGTTVTLTSSTPPTGASFNPSLPQTTTDPVAATSEFGWTPAATQIGPNFITLTATNSFGCTATMTVEIDVTGTPTITYGTPTNNSNPTADGSIANPYAVCQGDALQIPITANNPNADAETLSVGTLPANTTLTNVSIAANGTATSTAGGNINTTLTYTPTVGQDGVEQSITLTAADTGNPTCTVTQTLYFEASAPPTIHAPAAITGHSPRGSGTGNSAGSPIVVCAGMTLTFGETATDSQSGTTVSLSATGVPANMTFSNQTLPATGTAGAGTVSTTASFTPDNTQANQAFSVTFTATNQFGCSSTRTVFLFVDYLQFDTPPTPTPIGSTSATGAVLVACVGQTLTYDVQTSFGATGTPSSGDTLTLGVTGTPVGAAHDPDQLGVDTLGPNGSDLLASSSIQPPGTLLHTRFSWTPVATDVNAAPYVLTYTVEDSFGCDITQDVSIYVVPTPTVTATVNGNPITAGQTLPVCVGNTLTIPITGASSAGDQVQLTETGAPGSPDASFAPPLPLTGAPANSTFTLTPDGDNVLAGTTFTVTLTATDNAALTLATSPGCPATASLTFQIRVDGPPTIGITNPSPAFATGNNLYVCAGSTVQFDVAATDTNLTNEVTLSESDPDGLSAFFQLPLPVSGNPATASQPSVAQAHFKWVTPLTAPAKTTLTFKATDTDGCTATPVTVTIHVRQSPAVSPPAGITGQQAGDGTQGNPLVVCVGGTLGFGVTASNPNPGDSVILSATGTPANATFTGGTSAPGAAEPGTFSFSPAANQGDASFQVVFTATDDRPNGCASSLTVYLRVSSLPVIAVSGASPSLDGNNAVTICAGTNVTFTVAATDTNAGDEVTLSENDSNGLAQFFTPVLPLTGNTAAGGTNSTATSVFNWTPPATAAGSSNMLKFTASNTDGCAAVPVTVTINVSALPTFVAPTPAQGSTLVVCAGQTLNWTVEATSNNTGQDVTLTDGGSNPSGTTSTGTSSGATTADVNYTLTPPANAAGQTYNVMYTATLAGTPGCPQTRSFQIRVDGLPTISLTNSSPSLGGGNNIFVCAGGTVQFDVTASDANPTNEVTLSESGGLAANFQPQLPLTGNIVTGSQASTVNSQFKWVTTPTSPAKTKLTLTATDTDGCVTTTTVTIHVRQTPVVSPPAGITGQQAGDGTQGNPLVVCVGGTLGFGVTASNPNPGDSVILSATGTPANATFTGGTSAPGAAEPGTFSFSPAANQGDASFQVVFTATDDRPNGCASSLTVYIRVSSLPVIAVSGASPSLDGNNAVTICAGTNVTFTVAATDTNAGDEVTLSENDSNGLAQFFTPVLPLTGNTAAGGTNSTATSVFNWTPPATAAGSSNVLKFTASNTDGCAAVPVTVTINVSALPTFVAPTPAQGSTLVVCAGQTLNWTVEATSNNTGQDVTLTDGGSNPSGTTSTGTSSGATTADVNYTLTPPANAAGQTYNVMYTATLAGTPGCPQARSFQIRVDGLPTISLTNSSPSLGGGNNIFVCAGGTVQFDVTASDANPTNEVTLSESGGLAANFQPQLPLTGNIVTGSQASTVNSQFKWVTTPTSPAKTKLTLTATDTDGCVTTTTVTIHVRQTPVVSPPAGITGQQAGDGTQGNPLVVCVGGTLGFGVTASNPNPGDSVILSATGTPANATFTGGTSAPGAAEPGTFSFSPAANQGDASFQVVFTATDDRPNGCASSLTVYIRVSSLPVIAVSGASPSLDGNNAVTICAGTNVTFTVAATDTNAGDEVTLSENDSNGLAQFFTPVLPLTGNTAAGGTNSTATSVFNWTPPATAAGSSNVLKFTASNTDGCAAVPVTVTINVSALPTFVAPTPAQGSTLVVCAGQTLNWTVEATSNNTGQDVTLTDGGSNPSGTTSTGTSSGATTADVNYTLTPPANAAGQTYNVMYTATLAGTPGCPQARSFQIRVDGLPTISLTNSSPALGGGNNIFVCAGGTVQFDVTASDANPTNEVTLSESGGLAANFQPQLPLTGNIVTGSQASTVNSQFKWVTTPTSPAKTKLTLTATDTDGCVTTTTVTIHVRQTPVVSPPAGITGQQAGDGTQGNPLVVCVGGTLGFGVTASNPNPGDSVILSATGTPANATFTGGTSAPGASEPGTFSFSPAANQGDTSFQVVFTATDDRPNGCTSSLTVYLRVSSLPVISVSGAQPGLGDGNNVTICAGTNVTFTVAATDTNAGDEVTLSENDTNGLAQFFTPVLPLTGNTATAGTNSTVTSVFKWTPPATAAGSSNLLTFTAANTDGCAAAPVTVTINVSALPTFVSPPTPAQGSTLVVTAGQTLNWEVEATSNNTGQSVSLTDTGTNPGGTTSTGTSSGASTANVNYSFTPPANASAQTYTVTYTATLAGAQGCPQTWSFQIRVSSLPVITLSGETPTFSEGPNPSVTVCSGTPVSFTVSAADQNAGEQVTLSESGGLAQFFTPDLPLTSAPGKGGTDSVTSSFSWTPGPGAPATSVLTFNAVNTDGSQAPAVTVTINVVQTPHLMVGPANTSGDGSQGNPFQVSANAAGSTSNVLTFPITATEPNANDTVTLSQTGAPTMDATVTGPTFSPSLPATGTLGASVTSTFTFTPTASQAGPLIPIVFTATNNAGPNGCPDMRTVYIQVNSLPTITVSPSNPSYTVCAGTPVTFSVLATVTNPGGEVTLSETGGLAQFFTPALPFTGNKATATTPSNVQTTFNWTPGLGAPATTTLVFTATDTDGASVNSSVTINVVQVPTVSVSAATNGTATSGNGTQGSPFVVCVAPTAPLTFTVTANEPNAQDEVTLTDANLPANATMTQSLPLISADSGESVSSVFAFSPAANQGGQTFGVTYTATDSSTAGCSSSVTVYIRVSSLPVITLSGASPAFTGDGSTNIMICDGDTATFKVTFQDTNAGGSATLSEIGAPASGTFAPTLPRTAAAPTTAQTTFTYTSPRGSASSTSPIVFTATNADGCTTQQTVNLIVFHTVPTTLTLSGFTPANPAVGDQVCLTANVLDNCPNGPRPYPGEPVTFTLNGTAGTSPGEGTSTTVTTDANGNAQFCFTVLTPGTISVTAVGEGISGAGGTGTTGTVTVNPPPVNTAVDTVTGSGLVDSQVAPGPVVTGGAQFNVSVSDNAKHKVSGSLNFNIAGASVKGHTTQLDTLVITPITGGYTATLTGLMTIVQHGASSSVKFQAQFTQLGTSGGTSDSFQLSLFQLNGDDITSPTMGSNLRLVGRDAGLTNNIIIRVGKTIPVKAG